MHFNVNYDNFILLQIFIIKGKIMSGILSTGFQLASKKGLGPLQSGAARNALNAIRAFSEGLKVTNGSKSDDMKSPENQRKDRSRYFTARMGIPTARFLPRKSKQELQKTFESIKWGGLPNSGGSRSFSTDPNAHKEEHFGMVTKDLIPGTSDRLPGLHRGAAIEIDEIIQSSQNSSTEYIDRTGPADGVGPLKDPKTNYVNVEGDETELPME